MAPSFVLGELVSGFLHCSWIVILGCTTEWNYGIKYGLVGPFLFGCHAQMLDLPLNFLLYCLDLFAEIEFLEQLREVINVVFIVHLRKFFKDDELVYGAVDLFAPRLFEGHEMVSVCTGLLKESLDVIVGLRKDILILPLSLASYVDRAMYALVQALSLGIRDLCVQFELLVVREELLCILGRLVVPLGQLPDIGVHFCDIVNVFLAFCKDAVELFVLLVDESLKARHAVLGHVLRKFLGSTRLGMAIFFEALHFSAEETALNGVLIASSLRNPVKVLGIDVFGFNSQTQQMNYFFDFLLPLGVVLPLHFQVLKQRKHGRRTGTAERVEGQRLQELIHIVFKYNGCS